MFKRLRDTSSEIDVSKKKKQDTYKEKYNKCVQMEKKRMGTYGEKFRKKSMYLHQTIPDLEIVQSEQFLYQGRLSPLYPNLKIPKENQPAQEKHGQGVMFMKNGTLIAGTWDHGMLQGRALIVSPFGGRTMAYFSNGKLSGWSITMFASRMVICSIFYEDKLDGEKIMYESLQQTWVGSKYSANTNTFKIVHLEKGFINKLPNFILIERKNQELIDLYEHFMINQDICLCLENPIKMTQQIQCLTLTDNLIYVGYCNEEKQPDGLGVLYGINGNEYYMGHFKDGSLEYFGRLVFQNGQLYQGELSNGVFSGQGVYYSPTNNLSTIVLTNKDEQKVLSEHEGYICIDVGPIGGGYCRYIEGFDKGFSLKALELICSSIESYYMRYFIKKETKQNVNFCSDTQEFGVSEHNEDENRDMHQLENKQNIKQDISSSNKKVRNEQSPPKRENESHSNVKDQVWLNFKNQKPHSKRKHKESNQIDFPQVKRVYSLDKRDAKANRQKGSLAESSNPINRENFNPPNRVDSLDSQINRLGLNRKLTSNDKKKINTNQRFAILNSNNPRNFQSVMKVKQNVCPEEREAFKKNTPQNGLMVKKKNSSKFQESNQSSEVMPTFREDKGTLNVVTQKKRRYSQNVDSSEVLSINSSVVSNLSHKVDGLLKKDSSKRKKIFV